MFESTLMTRDGVHQVRASGRLDSSTALDFEKSVLPVFDQPVARVAFDFSALEYISSAGLRVILMALKRAEQSSGQMIFFGIRPHIMELLEISGFLKLLETTTDLSAALKRLTPQG